MADHDTHDHTGIPGVGGSVASLDDVGDINAPTPANGDVLTWDSTPGEWVAAAPAGGSGFVGCKAYNNTTLALTSGGTRVVTFNSEDFDTSTFHDNSTNPGLFTVPSTGYYRVTAHLYQTGTVQADFIWRVNGSTLYGDVNMATTAGAGYNMTALLSLAATNTVELVCVPSSNITLGHASLRQAQIDFEIEFLGA